MIRCRHQVNSKPVGRKQLEPELQTAQPSKEQPMQRRHRNLLLERPKSGRKLILLIRSTVWAKDIPVLRKRREAHPTEPEDPAPVPTKRARHSQVDDLGKNEPELNSAPVVEKKNTRPPRLPRHLLDEDEDVGENVQQPRPDTPTPVEHEEFQDDIELSTDEEYRPQSNDEQDQSEYHGSEDEDGDLGQYEPKPAALKDALSREIPQWPAQRNTHDYMDVDGFEDEHDGDGGTFFSPDVAPPSRRQPQGHGKAGDSIMMKQAQYSQNKRAAGSRTINTTIHWQRKAKDQSARRGSHSRAAKLECSTGQATTQNGFGALEFCNMDDNDVQQIRNNSNPSRASHSASDWPADIQLVYSKRHKVGLREQTAPIQTVVYSSFKAFTKDLLFSSEYLTADLKFAHQRKILIKCVDTLIETEQQDVYEDIKMRLSQDTHFAKDLIEVAEERNRQLRGKVKSSCAAKVGAHYSITNDANGRDRAMRLTTDLAYIYPGDIEGTLQTNKPFKRSIFAEVLRELFFQGATPVATEYAKYFKSSVHLDSGREEPEIPPAMLAIVTAYIFVSVHEKISVAALGSSAKFKADFFDNEYRHVMTFLDDIRNSRPGAYHFMMNKLFEDACDSGTSRSSSDSKANGSLALLKLNELPEQ
ncbi:hypothetical protein B0H21DRAFT_881805 [Amylocystis lapponica]|nr:hypothetical protein B0H21DRAFT_881805 [Amylocystis lapponica]